MGDPKDTAEIILDDSLVQVTTNLLACLKRVRRWYHYQGHLWVDALCINQYDTNERNSQVYLMREIYEQSRGIYIWLGDDEQDFGLAHNQCLLSVYASHTYSEDSSDIQKQLLERMGGPHLTPEMFEPLFRFFFPKKENRWRAICNLLPRPYWTRCWVLQEFVHANGVLILRGRKSMSLHILLEASHTWDQFFPIHRCRLSCAVDNSS
jgi:hypothetical protein